MKTPNPHVDPFVEADPFVAALRGDLPSAADEARVRARLLAVGVAVTGATLSTSSAASPFCAATGVTSGTIGAVPGGAAVSGGALAAGAPAALVKAGLLSKVLLLPVAAKVGVATTLAVAVAATSVPLVLRDEAPAEARTAQAAPAARELAPGLPTRGQVEAPALDPAPARAGSEAREASGGVASGNVEPAGVEPSDGAARAPARSAAPAAPKAARAGETRVGRGESDGTETNGVQRRRVASVESAPPRRASQPATGRSAADEPSAAAPVVRDGSEDGRTELVRASSLGEETRLMEQAMVALGEGDRELARRSLEEHARRFPGGLLQRERERALARLRQADVEQPATGSSR